MLSGHSCREGACAPLPACGRGWSTSGVHGCAAATRSKPPTEDQVPLAEHWLTGLDRIAFSNSTNFRGSPGGTPRSGGASWNIWAAAAWRRPPARFSASSIRGTPRRSNAMPPEALDRMLDEGVEMARSLEDSVSMLIHLDVEYVNFDDPAAAYLDPQRIFQLQEPLGGGDRGRAACAWHPLPASGHRPGSSLCLAHSKGIGRGQSDCRVGNPDSL
jgi:hypothetical protein